MKNKGITLVALVVTIVIMLILAGVTLNIVLGENGLIKQAQRATDVAKESMKNEEENLGMLADELNGVIAQSLPSTVKEAIQKGTIFTVNKQIKDATGKTMTVPKGFKVKEEELIENGVVIADSEGNEFVWVPCTIDEYKKHDYEVKEVDDTSNKADGKNNDKGWRTYYYRKYTDWKDDEIDEAANKKSVEKNKGFYIARYEAGVPSNADFYVDASSTQKTYQTSKNDIGSNLKPVSKKEVQTWNLINQPNAKTVSGRMYSGDGYGVRSQLVDGTAWDTIVTWMSKEYIGIEKDSTIHGNYRDNNKEETRIKEDNCLFAEHLYKSKKTDNSNVGWCQGKSYQYGKFTSGWTANWTDTNGDASTKYNSYDNDTGTYKYNHYVEMSTGASDNTKLKNIYDMAGNIAEWTTEYGYRNSESDGTKYAVLRGGSFSSDGIGSIAERNALEEAVGTKSYTMGFRVVLYIK